MKGAFLNPAKVLDEVDLKENMIAAEFGCGSGGFVIPLAKRLEKGRVYGLDVQQEPLSALKGKASLEGINNIEIKRCDLEQEKGSNFPPSFLDLVIISNVLFQIKNKEAVLKEAKRTLKRGSQLLMIDWLKRTELGPKEGRISKKEAKEMAKDLGFKIKKEFEAGKYHWGLVLEK